MSKVNSWTLEEKKAFLKRRSVALSDGFTKMDIVSDRKQLERRLRKEQYATYLKSSEWKARRNATMERDRNLCRVCKSERAAAVHHLSYDRIYNEPLYDLISVCNSCHDYLHYTD